MRNFGLSRPRAVGGIDQPAGSLRGIRNAPLLPAGPLMDPGGSPFKRGNALQALIDCLAVGFALFFICVTAVSITLAIFMLVGF